MDLLMLAKDIARRVEVQAWETKVPVKEGEVVAGVGVSGGTTEQDIAIVECAMQ